MRRNLEGEAVELFEDVAKRRGFSAYRGQGNANRIAVAGRNYLQFGDLRVETPERSVVVEVESAGGVGNLVKYWYLLAGGKPMDKPIMLLHVFQQVSISDYQAHFPIWEFLAGRMRDELGDLLKATRFVYTSLGDLAPALAYFDQALNDVRDA